MKRFLALAVLVAIVLALFSLAVYQWLKSPVSVEVQLSHTRDYTSQVNRFFMVDDAGSFPDIVTLEMSRWQAWQLDRSNPIYIMERKQ